MQGLQIDLRVDASGIGMLVAQHCTNLGQRRALAQHIAGQPMAKLMRAKGGRVDPCSLEAMSNHGSHAACAVEPSNRRLGAQKNTPRRALGPAVAQVRRDRFADIRRKRQLAPAALAAHGELPRAPIDVIELQRHHFARSQSEPGQHQQDRIVAPSHRALPIDAGEELLSLLRGDRPWDRGHGPVGHNRNGGDQIQCDLSAHAGVSEKGAQRRRHELRSLHVQTSGATLNECHGVFGSQTRKMYCSIAELILEKVSDKRDVVDDGRPTQRSVLAKILLLAPCTDFGRPDREYRGLLRWDSPPTAQVRHEMLQRRYISAGGSSLAMSASQIPGYVFRVDAPSRQSPALEPLAEARSEHDLPLQIVSFISLQSQRGRICSKVLREWTFRYA